MNYQAILDFLAPLDAFVMQHPTITCVLEAWAVLFVLHICRKRYGTILDTKKPGDGYGFLEEQAKSEWQKWKNKRNEQE